jgi:hypothetical protein
LPQSVDDLNTLFLIVELGTLENFDTLIHRAANCFSRLAGVGRFATTKQD